ncbi:hypothetical protein [Actinoplanes couchii]|uniref:hypothetical protein n=1 Tax=Actinoplanes couchii TaxID=403638 RepID=UPI00286CEF54|nr:hypothetical protein [Actinoplanes couchii]
MIGLVFATAPAPARAAFVSSIGGPITRAEVMERAQYWLDHQPGAYSQTGFSPDPIGSRNYRRDCSGYVDMAWHLGVDYTTHNLERVATRISRADLRPGDVLNSTQFHVILFKRWSNSEHTRFDYYSFGSTPVKLKTNIPITDNWDSHPNSGYIAMRYNRIIEDGASGTSPYADGTLLREPNGSIAVMAGGAAFAFNSMDELNAAGYAGRPYVSVAAGTLATLPPTRVADGTLVRRSDGSIAVIAGGAAFSFASMTELTAAGYGSRPFVNIGWNAYNALPARPREGTIIRRTDDGSMSVVAGGAKFAFVSMAEVTAAGYGSTPFVNVGITAYNAVPTEPADGTLLRRSDGSIGVIAGGARFDFVSMAEFTAAGYDSFINVGTPAFNGVSTTPANGTFVKATGEPGTWRLADGKRTPATPGAGQPVTSLPLGALRAIPTA